MAYYRDELVRYQLYVEAMTIEHDPAPAAQSATQLASPTLSLRSVRSATLSVSSTSLHSSASQYTLPPAIGSQHLQQRTPLDSRLSKSSNSGDKSSRESLTAKSSGASSTTEKLSDVSEQRNSSSSVSETKESTETAEHRPNRAPSRSSYRQALEKQHRTSESRDTDNLEVAYV